MLAFVYTDCKVSGINGRSSEWSFVGRTDCASLCKGPDLGTYSFFPLDVNAGMLQCGPRFSIATS